PEARFCMSFPRIGAVADFGAHYLLPRIVGLSAARGILLTGRAITAGEACELGIVHAIHDAATLPQAARALARQVCKGPADALPMSKRMLNLSLGSDYAAMANMEAASRAVATAADLDAGAVKRVMSRQAHAEDWGRAGPSIGMDARAPTEPGKP